MLAPSSLGARAVAVHYNSAATSADAEDAVAMSIEARVEASVEAGAALHSFAAQNQARMEAMAAARRQVDSRLPTLRGDERRVRQDQIADEIIELSPGELAGRSRGDIVAGK